MKELMTGDAGRMSTRKRWLGAALIAAGLLGCAVTPALAESSPAPDQTASAHRPSDAKPVDATKTAADTDPSSNTSVACNPTTVAVGQGTMCTAYVWDISSPLSGSTPTGTVTFTSSGSGVFSPTSSCTLSTLSVGIASCSVTYTPGGVAPRTDTITAVYGGGGGFTGSSFTTTVSVTAATRSTSTSVNCVPNTLVATQMSTCTATVTDTSPGLVVSPGGTVGFTTTSGTGVFTAAPCTLASITTGVSACSVTYTPGGVAPRTDTITATYTPAAGDPHTGSSGTTTVSVVTARHPTTTTVACVSIPFSLAANCTVTVTDIAGSPTTPTGTVAFTSSPSGSFTPNPCTLVGTGATASCSVTFTKPFFVFFPITVIATYSGDLTHLTSVGTTLV